MVLITPEIDEAHNLLKVTFPAEAGLPGFAVRLQVDDAEVQSWQRQVSLTIRLWIRANRMQLSQSQPNNHAQETATAFLPSRIHPATWHSRSRQFLPFARRTTLDLLFETRAVHPEISLHRGHPDSCSPACNKGNESQGTTRRLAYNG